MRDIVPAVLFAVFYEMFGLWLCLLVVVTPLVLLALVALLVAERRIYGKRLAWGLLFGLVGGVVAEIIVVQASASGYADAGGPVDWVLIELIFLAGWFSALVVFYTLVGWWQHLRSRVAIATA